MRGSHPPSPPFCLHFHKTSITHIAMSKYRILQVGDTFYPQERKMFVWCNFEDSFAGYDIYVTFGSLSGARAFLDCHIAIKENCAPSQHVIVHKYP